jgi:hypothetical protein
VSLRRGSSSSSTPTIALNAPTILKSRSTIFLEDTANTTANEIPLSYAPGRSRRSIWRPFDVCEIAHIRLREKRDPRGKYLSLDELIRRAGWYRRLVFRKRRKVKYRRMDAGRSPRPLPPLTDEQEDAIDIFEIRREMISAPTDAGIELHDLLKKLGWTELIRD